MSGWSGAKSQQAPWKKNMTRAGQLKDWLIQRRHETRHFWAMGRVVFLNCPGGVTHQQGTWFVRIFAFVSMIQFRYPTIRNINLTFASFITCMFSTSAYTCATGIQASMFILPVLSRLHPKCFSVWSMVITKWSNEHVHQPFQSLPLSTPKCSANALHCFAYLLLLRL